MPDFITAATDTEAEAKATIERAFRTHYAGLVAFAAQRTRSVAEAEDLVQDVFLGLWRRRAELPVDDAMRPYLYRAVHNRALNAIRNDRTAGGGSDTIEAQVAHTAQPDEEVEARELDQLVNAAVARLPERCRMVFLLSRESGLSYSEIAETLGISVKTVETQMGRALKFLRSELAAFVS